MQIFRMFIEGKAASKIAQELTRAGIPTPSGKTKWSYSTVMSILQNEKYKGDALLQKGFTVDFLTKKFKKNEGRSRSTMWKRAMSRSSPRRNLTLCRRN